MTDAATPEPATASESMTSPAPPAQSRRSFAATDRRKTDSGGEGEARGERPRGAG